MKLGKITIAAAIFVALFITTSVFLTHPVRAEPSDASGGIIATGNISDYIWSSDGTHVAFIKYLTGQSWGELWVGDWDGSRVTNLQSIYSEIELGGLEDWQGDWILLRIRHENELPAEYYGRGELWKIRSDGTNLTQITFTYTDGIRTQWWNTYYNNIGTARWGRFIPGTDLVYFSAHDGNGWWKAYACHANGTDGWQLISGSTYSFTIGMSPTGNKLLWGTASYYDQPTTLIASNVNGSGVVIVKTFSAVTWPLVLADGKTVIYSNPNGSIGAIQVDGTNDSIVLDDDYTNSWVSCHPVDEQSFLMRSNRSSDGNFHIFSVDTDGSQIIQLTNGSYDDDGAMFSPNGQNLMYRRHQVGSSGAPYELVITGATSITTTGTTDWLVPIFVVAIVAVVAGAICLRSRGTEEAIHPETVTYDFGS
ncbi:MAG: PD40 domain-containing protein [Candidatus Thorarchaeota archaeon]|nr:PD40 domain-containing protein [Candidatus Thorarchaeota archaeon]